MNSASGSKLSMEELKKRNPAELPQAETPTPPEAPLPPQPILIQCAIPETVTRLELHLRRLEEQSAEQTLQLKKLAEMRSWLPTRMQMDELTREVTALRQMIELAGKKKEWRFSLPKLRLRLPQLSMSGPALVTLLMALAALLLIWLAWAGGWNNLSLLS